MPNISNPFANYQISIPNKYSEQVRKFCKQANSKEKEDYVPFNRQVDFWYFSFLYATKEGLEPDYIPESEKSNITFASILDNYQILHMQMAYLANKLSIESLLDSREIFKYISAMANAGMPHVIQLLSDEDDNPLGNLFYKIELMLRK